MESFHSTASGSAEEGQRPRAAAPDARYFSHSSQPQAAAAALGTSRDCSCPTSSFGPLGHVERQHWNQGEPHFAL